MTRTACFAALAAALAVAGCSSSTEPKCYPAAGRVTVDGQGVENAQVVFHALGNTDAGGLYPQATTDKDGFYRLSTIRTNDGAPAGDYNVTVTWSKPSPLGEPPEDLLREQYASPANPAARVTIKAGDNEVPPLDLKAPPQ